MKIHQVQVTSLTFLFHIFFSLNTISGTLHTRQTTLTRRFVQISTLLFSFAHFSLGCFFLRDLGCVFKHAFSRQRLLYISLLLLTPLPFITIISTILLFPFAFNFSYNIFIIINYQTNIIQKEGVSGSLVFFCTVTMIGH